MAAASWLYGQGPPDQGRGRRYLPDVITNLTTRHSHSFGGEFLELVPNERIRHTDKFDDPGLPGQMQTTVSLKKVSVGTELTVVQEGIPSAIPVEACYLGWQESLTLLTQLVEAEIKDSYRRAIRGYGANAWLVIWQKSASSLGASPRLCWTSGVKGFVPRAHSDEALDALRPRLRSLRGLHAIEDPVAVGAVERLEERLRPSVPGEGLREVRRHTRRASSVVRPFPSPITLGALNLCESRNLHRPGGDQRLGLRTVDLRPRGCRPCAG